MCRASCAPPDDRQSCAAPWANTDAVLRARAGNLHRGVADVATQFEYFEVTPRAHAHDALQIGQSPVARRFRLALARTARLPASQSLKRGSQRSQHWCPRTAGRSHRRQRRDCVMVLSRVKVRFLLSKNKKSHRSPRWLFCIDGYFVPCAVRVPEICISGISCTFSPT